MTFRSKSSDRVLSEIRELRRRPDWQDIPVVVVTAMQLTEVQRRQLAGKVDSMLQKSAYTRNELLTEVSRLLKKIDA